MKATLAGAAAAAAVIFIALAEPALARHNIKHHEARSWVEARRWASRQQHQKRRHLHPRQAAADVNCTTTGDPANLAPGSLSVADGCSQYYVPVAGDFCYSVVAQFPGLTLDGFYQANPEVGTNDCPNLQPSLSYCVAGPTDLQSGSWDLNAGCAKFHEVQLGETCDSIVDAIGDITLSQFYTWNPELNSDCTNLIAGYSYCSCDGGASSSEPTVTVIAPDVIESTAPLPTWTADAPAPSSTDGGDPGTDDVVSGGDSCDTDNDSVDDGSANDNGGDDCDDTGDVEVDGSVPVSSSGVTPTGTPDNDHNEA